MNLKEAAEKYKVLKDQIKALKDQQTELQKEFDEIRLKIIPDLMEEQGVGTVTFKGVGRVQLAGDLNVSIPADKREEAYDWLEKHGHGDIIKPGVHPSTLKGFVKEALREGEELPEDIFRTHLFTRASVVKA